MRRQRGLGAPFVLALLAGSLGALAMLGGHSRNQRLAHEHADASLLRAARDALIARAVGDENRPGSLPCPDFATDSDAWSNHPGDGKADMLTRNQCPSAIGWLPWITLSLPAAHDRQGNALWYVMAPGLRDDDSALPINSDTPSGLAGEGQSEFAALLIAPGSPLTGQARPNSDPANYLEGLLIGDAPLQYRPAELTNDRHLAISKAELMAAVERKVAQHLRACLLAHGHASGQYPWPAPLTSDNFEGHAETRFGRVPATRPGTGPAQSLNTLNLRLTAAGNAPNDDPAATLQAITESTVALRNFLGTLDAAAAELSLSANQLQSQLQSLESLISSAVANGRIARSEGGAITRQSDIVTATVNTVSSQLFRLGFDAPRADSGPESTGQHLQDQGATLQAVSAEFQVRDLANPRPVQATLVPDVQRIATAAQALAITNQAILGQLSRVQSGASATRSAQRALLDAIESKGGARDALAAWTTSPDRSTEAAWLRSMQTLRDLRAPLIDSVDILSQASKSHDAAAWPMFWEAAACDFLAEGSDRWWTLNQWRNSLFYQIDTADASQRGELQVDHHDALAVVVIAAGAARPGQVRQAGSGLAAYLEGDNAHASREGEATRPIRRFFQSTTLTTANDQLAF
ncbi:MAG: hypothetical protein L6Q40_00165 [Azonexus sp.]|nr:hypothetical protein [Azonexus sp.]